MDQRLKMSDKWRVAHIQNCTGGVCQGQSLMSEHFLLTCGGDLDVDDPNRPIEAGNTAAAQVNSSSR